MEPIHFGARDGIRELISELGSDAARNVFFYVLANKWILLIPSKSESSKAMLIRPVDELTVGYGIHIPGSDTAPEHLAKVSRAAEGQLQFCENGQLFTAAQFFTKLASMVSGNETPTRPA